MLTSFENKKRELVDLSKPIIVGMESYAPFTEAKVMSDDGLDWHIPLMFFDMCSRNANLYPLHDTKQSFTESTFVQENLRNRTWYGEAEHPPADSPMSRFMFIEPTRYAWNITSLEDHGDHYEGNVSLCAPLGTGIIHPNTKRLGSNYAASCRIATPNYVVKEQGGKKIYVKKYKMYPITFDCVTTPGIPPCRLIKDGVYKPGPVGVGQESSNAAMLAEFTNPADEVIKMMASEESGRIIQDIYGIDFKNAHAILTKDNKVKLSTEDGLTATVALNSYILSSVLKK